MAFIALALLCSLIAVFLSVAPANASASPPHILFVVVDDLGWSDVGFHGSKIQTPNIDKLASEGVVLDNYYVLPICTPTRSALMTGRYPIHTGLQHLVLFPASPYGLPLNFATLPQKLKESVQAPQKYVDKYSFIKDETRRTYAGMADIMDEAVGNITDAMKDAGLWDDTLMIFTTDNGGSHTYGGFNWPLRGEKWTLWEGGVRGVSFVHGNMLGRTGVKCEGLLHVTDWYPTLVNLAGGTLDHDPSPLDGMDVWNTISHGKPSPRKEILLNIDPIPSEDDNLGTTIYEGIALRVGDMKLLLNVPNSTWFKPPELGGEPDKKQGIPHEKDEQLAGLAAPTKEAGDVIDVALYNVTADPKEHEDLSEKLPDVVKALKERVQYYMKGVVPPLNKPLDSKAFIKAESEGVWTPWEE
ncbi:hypothetical protein ACROYT_G001741 [Oculina patagonica]